MSVADPKTAPHPFDLLDEARDRLAAALPEIDREGTHYVAHLSALSQLVEIRGEDVSGAKGIRTDRPDSRQSPTT